MRYLLMATLLMIGGAVFSQTDYLETTQETQDLSEKVVQLFKKEKFSKAFRQMRPVWPIPESEIDNVESKTIDYLSTLSNRYGDIEGYAKVKNEAISDFALRETYLLQYEYSAIRIVFTYYRNGNGWILNTFSWDEDFEATFKDTSQ